MPIECPIQFPKLDIKTFQQLDYQVMKLSFETQADLGRNCDEEIYHNNLAARLEEIGLGPSHVEVLIRVRHGSFLKEYKIDLAAAGQAIYELKAVKEITKAHEGQTLNYLLLADCEHGKVVNFGGSSVDSRFVNNPLSKEKRYRFETTSTSWSGPDSLRQAFVHLIEDIGLFLETPLYNQALVHCHGGPEHAMERRPLQSNGRSLGKQVFQMCSPYESFRVTALTQNLRAQRTSFEKLLALSDLKAMHWINLNRHQVEFTTLLR